MANAIQGLIFDIKKFSLHDGPGIRTTVFFKGCHLDCPWCHNPESQKSEPEIIKRDYKGSETDILPQEELVGRYMTINDVFSEIKKDNIFYEESGGGVTFSGGEPLLQLDFLYQLLKACKIAGFHTTVDTSGATAWKSFEKINPYVDLYLFDIKLLDEHQHKKYIKTSNSQILTNLKHLDQVNKRVIIRVPVVPTITDTPKNRALLIELLKSLKNIKEVSLLPYHKIGLKKYHQLQRINRLEGLEPPTQEDLEQFSTQITSEGFTVKIGG